MNTMPLINHLKMDTPKICLNFIRHIPQSTILDTTHLFIRPIFASSMPEMKNQIKLFFVISPRIGIASAIGFMTIN